jgi:acyl carrier protein
MVGEIVAESRFMADLGLDSMQVVGLVFLWEHTFDVSIGDQEEFLSRLDTVGQAIDALRLLQTSVVPRV